MSKIKKIFSTPLYQTTAPQEILEEITIQALPKLDKLLDQDRDIMRNPMSSDFFGERIVKPEEAQNFFDWILECTNEYCEETGYHNGNRMNYWFQDYRQDGMHRRHNHGISRVSGVFWIRANEQAGDLILENPVSELGTVQDNINNPMGDYTAEHEFITPSTGMLVLFPGFIYHEVMPSLEGVVRTVMAFNMDR